MCKRCDDDYTFNITFWCSLYAGGYSGTEYIVLLSLYYIYYSKTFWATYIAVISLLLLHYTFNLLAISYCREYIVYGRHIEHGELLCIYGDGTTNSAALKCEYFPSSRFFFTSFYFVFLFFASFFHVTFTHIKCIPSVKAHNHKISLLR